MNRMCISGQTFSIFASKKWTWLTAAYLNICILWIMNKAHQDPLFLNFLFFAVISNNLECAKFRRLLTVHHNWRLKGYETLTRSLVSNRCDDTSSTAPHMSFNIILWKLVTGAMLPSRHKGGSRTAQISGTFFAEPHFWSECCSKSTENLSLCHLYKLAPTMLRE